MKLYAVEVCSPPVKPTGEPPNPADEVWQPLDDFPNGKALGITRNYNLCEALIGAWKSHAAAYAFATPAKKYRIVEFEVQEKVIKEMP